MTPFLATTVMARLGDQRSWSADSTVCPERGQLVWTGRGGRISVALEK